MLFGYYNPILHYGCERLCADAARAGIDGLLVVDLPPEEAAELARPARAHGLDIIYLLAPTTPVERVRTIAHSAQRLSLLRLGDRRDRRAHQPRRRARDQRARPAHGDRSADRRRLRHLDRRRRRATSRGYADAVVVGSALSLIIEREGAGPGLAAAVGEVVGAMKEAMRVARGQGRAATGG